MLRTSERGTLKGCEWRWYLEFVRMLKPKVASPALRFGTLCHLSLADYYPPGIKRGPHPAKTFLKHFENERKFIKETFGARVLKNADEDEKWVSAQELGPAMMTNYVDYYGSDDKWEVLVTEYPFKVLIHHPETGEPWFWYTGIVDGVWKHRISKEIWIPDHKSTAGIGGTAEHPSTPPHLRIDDQAGAYWSYGVEAIMLAELMRKNQQLAGMLYNYLRKAMPDERHSKIVGGKRVYLNLDGTISKKQPAPYFARINIYRDEFDREMARHRSLNDYRRTELLREGTLEPTKRPSLDCGWCWARDACELHETGADAEQFLKDTTMTWDPYAAHEIRDGEQK